MGDAKDSQSRRSIGDMRWSRFLAIVLGLIGAVAAGIIITLLQLDEGAQDTADSASRSIQLNEFSE